MNALFQVDSYHYKCKCCHKLHAGPTRILEFHCVSEQILAHGAERIYEADFAAVCDCDQPIHINFRVREYPVGLFEYHGSRSAEAEVIVAPKVRERLDTVAA